MKKLVLTLFLLSIWLQAYPQAPDFEPEEIILPSDEEIAKSHEYTNEVRLPLPDGEVYIIHASELNEDAVAKRNNYLKERNLLQEKGYIEDNSSEARGLLVMRNPDNQVTRTLTHTLTDAKLTFPYSGIPFINKEDLIGYSRYGSWDIGWLGFSEFFKDEELCICRYERMNIILSHHVIPLVAEDLEYGVNNKPSTYMVRGNKKSGFIHLLEWYDDTDKYNLNCATEQFKSSQKDALYRLANKIDAVM